jgi:hypothetical protein
MYHYRRDIVRKTLFGILVILALCIVAGSLATASQIIGDVTPPAPVTPEPTPVPPTELPTTSPTTSFPPTTHPTTVPITEPTTEVTITVEPTLGGGKGWIDINCNVNGASVYFDGVPQGVTSGGILSVAVSPTATPVRTVTVTKAGYTSWSDPIPHMPVDKEHVPVYATINPVTTPTIPPVQTGVIYAQSTPGGAAIYLNGNLYGYASLTIPNLPPGTYSLKASLAGYTPDTQLINVFAGQTATYYPNLQPSPPAPRSTGTVSVISAPDHALVYTDGNYQGKSPLTVTLYPGSHSFRVTLPGYTDYSTSVYVNANTNQRLSAAMVPALSGTVIVASQPGAAFMDSTAQGSIKPSGSLSLYNIPGGDHLFKVTAPGYSDWINTMYVQPNTVTTITASLTAAGPKPAPAPATGGFTIVSTPSGADIYVDNLFLGYTPATPQGIVAGQHQVTLKYAGYVDYSSFATVNAGQTTPLAISLQPAPTPTPSSAPSPAVFIVGLLAATGFALFLRRRS